MTPINNPLYSAIEKVDFLAKGSKWTRLAHQPFKYIYSIFFKKFVYPQTLEAKTKEASLFSGHKMHIALPASIDIYLTGGKSHDSEIRLAKFLVQNLHIHDHFLDIGAHYGYFSIIASAVVKEKGIVYSIEPASFSYMLLKKNADQFPNIKAHNLAISDQNENITFYEFPNLYSEYNSNDIEQFKNESWFLKSPPKKTTIEATTIDQITSSPNFQPKLIKIDVEGHEWNVIKGGEKYIKNIAPTVILEYLSSERHNSQHQHAIDLLASWNYKTFIIDNLGSLIAIEDINKYLEDTGLESDNIVCIRS